AKPFCGACSRVVPFTGNSYLMAEKLWYGRHPVSSTTSSPSTSVLSSPRSQRMMLWISRAVLLIGIPVFLGVYCAGSAQDVHTTDANVSQNPVGQGPVDRHSGVGIGGGNVSATKVPASKDALGVARTFLETAVARKNLGVAYGLVGPWLKG